MASTKNIKEAIMIVMEAKARGIVWKLGLQIIHDYPSAIVNAWEKLDNRPEPCPVKVWFCCKCDKVVRAVGSDGRCGRCTPGANF